MPNFEKDYLDADSNLAKAEKNLIVALEKLDKARIERRTSDVTNLRQNAQAMERETESALEACHNAHHEFWQDVARQAERELEQVAGPILERINQARWAIGLAKHTKPGLAAIENMYAKGLPKITFDFPVPLVFPDSKALDRADEEI